MKDDRSSALMDALLDHVKEQRSRAKLDDQPFDLGVLTDYQTSEITHLINSEVDTLRNLGMNKLEWYDDALRSHLHIGGEELTFSISHVR